MTPLDLFLYICAVLGAIALFVSLPSVVLSAFAGVCGAFNWWHERKHRKRSDATEADKARMAEKTRAYWLRQFRSMR